MSGTASAADLPPTARRLLAAAQDILAERGYSELTMTAISQVSGVNRALVSYYFGGNASRCRGPGNPARPQPGRL